MSFILKRFLQGQKVLNFISFTHFKAEGAAAPVMDSKLDSTSTTNAKR